MTEPNTTYATDSKYYANHRLDADTEKCMTHLHELIVRYADEFENLPYEDALNGVLENLQVTKGEMEQNEPPFADNERLTSVRAPMAARTELDKLAAKKHILLYVNRCVRMYQGHHSSLINTAFASIVETMLHLGMFDFDEAETLLEQTLRKSEQ